MSSQWKWIIAASVFVTVAALAWGELVLDIEAPRLSLPEFHSIATTVAIPIGDYEQAMRRKYGSDAVIILTGVPPR